MISNAAKRRSEPDTEKLIAKYECGEFGKVLQRPHHRRICSRNMGCTTVSNTGESVRVNRVCRRPPPW